MGLSDFLWAERVRRLTPLAAFRMTTLLTEVVSAAHAQDVKHDPR